MALIPWHKAVTPRQDLREGKPLDAAEFAVHLDHVRITEPLTTIRSLNNSLKRTYLTESLNDLAAQVVRRLSGERTETSAAFNMSTQFGGGKTHSLTLLYHLAKNGSACQRLDGRE
jgi:predicted AAA+ superfamily ATPase